jgi:ribonuclease BN (tRNA processing enzyme)
MTVIEGLETEDPVVIDPPGVTRGAAGAELLAGLVEALSVEWVVALRRGTKPVPLADELAALPVEVICVPASAQARRPPKQERAARRTKLWDRFLAGGEEQTFAVSETPVLGTPPPVNAPEAWAGRQVGLLDAAGRTVQLGEVVRLAGQLLTVRMPPHRPVESPRFLIRDATRNLEGLLETAPRVGGQLRSRRAPAEMTPPPLAPDAGGPPVSSHVGWAWATLVGGVFGDPLLHVRLHHRKRSLLFDLGDPGRLAARVAHQVSDVFVSHAHIDHIAGFPWFLRSRIGPFGPCRMFGPAGMIDRIEHFIEGVTWDRIGDNGPVFEVAELHGDHLRRARLQPGKPRRDLPEAPVEEGVVLAEPEFSIRAAVCDHGIPSVAYAFLPGREINVRKDRLAARGLPPGPWLGALKEAIAGETPDAEIHLPDGTSAPAGELADDLLLVRPGKKLGYAADVADTTKNREKLVELVAGAHTFYCEAAFAEADREQAAATRHLSARAAAEIARAAGIERLAPFHFSKRYEHDPDRVYHEILAAAGPVRVLRGQSRGRW